MGDETPSLNWTLSISCIDCGYTGYPKPDPTKNVLKMKNGERIRGALLWFPNECPKCHNLKVISDPKPEERAKYLTLASAPCKK